MNRRLTVLLHLAFAWLLLCAFIAMFLLYGDSIREAISWLSAVKFSGPISTLLPFYIALAIIFVLASVIIWHMRCLVEKTQSSNCRLTLDNKRLKDTQRLLETQLEMSKMTTEELDSKLSDYAKRIEALSVESKELRNANSELNSYIDSLKKGQRQTQEDYQRLQIENEQLKVRLGKKGEERHAERKGESAAE